MCGNVEMCHEEYNGEVFNGLGIQSKQIGTEKYRFLQF